MKDKDYDIFDAGFDNFLHRGDELPLADSHRPIIIQQEKNIQNQGISHKAHYKNGILYFANREIDFNSKPNQKELLDIVFEKYDKEWFYDEIADRWDGLRELNLIKLPKNYWKRFDTAGIGINRAIAIETGIKDFIIKNTKKMRINLKYI